jgi:predicted DNA-binding transcriptional regulator AlpA
MKFLTKKQVRELTTLSFAHIARLESQGHFPRRRKLTEAPNGRVVWREDEIHEWMETRPVEHVKSPDASEWEL